MNWTAIAITAIICIALISVFAMGYKSKKRDQEIEKIQAATPTVLDYIFGGKKNGESDHNDD